MTHLWTMEPEIAVQATPGDAQPGAFIWTGRRHVVAGLCNAWRLHTGWWLHEAWRDYFKVQTEDGLLCTVYHDLVADRWHVVRVYD